jgi:hypothetical protein
MRARTAMPWLSESCTARHGIRSRRLVLGVAITIDDPECGEDGPATEGPR